MQPAGAECLPLGNRFQCDLDGPEKAGHYSAHTEIHDYRRCSMGKTAKKSGTSKVSIKDLEVRKRKGSSAGDDVKGGFAPQPEPPKQIISPIIRNIRPS